MSSGRDEPPINALPFTFSKTPMPTISIPAPAVVTPAPQPPTIALVPPTPEGPQMDKPDRKSTRLNSSHQIISYAFFSLKKKTTQRLPHTSHRITQLPL